MFFSSFVYLYIPFHLLQVTSSNSHVVVGIAILAVVLLISPVIIVLVRMVTRTLQVSGKGELVSAVGGLLQSQAVNVRAWLV